MDNIAVTGIGMMSKWGRTIDEFYESICCGKPAYENLPEPELSKKRRTLFLDNSTKRVYAAFDLALTDSGFDLNTADKDKIGIFLGNAFGSLDSTINFEMNAVKNGYKSIMPMDFINTVMNASAGQIAVLSEIKGMNVTVSNGSASSAEAISYCADMFAADRINAAIVGGTEENVWFYENYIKYYNMVPSDGVCIFIVERLEDAIHRGAHIYAVWKGGIGGYYAKADSENIFSVMKKTADNAGISLDELDLIVSGGVLQCENEAVSKIDIPKLYLKNIIGENYGAFGVFSAAAAISVIKKGKLPDGTVLTGEKQVMSVNAGFDGYISCFIISLKSS